MMRNFLFIILLAFANVCAFAWKPIFAGHRGSYTGVQNTVEAYQNGVDKYGYTGLECDVRVTADGKYVICHDETTNSLGGALTVATATLEQLKAETLTQTRGGVTYTGKICTVEEYLDVCLAKGAFPVIELKWATGINNNDMSNFPGLAELVKSKGLESKAVFLTSMKSSIEYIRTNYPAFNCQFLTGQYWANHFDWCVKWQVNPSIQAGYFDIYTVKKFRDVGLKVAVWTVNTAANYEKFGNMGVYMMTCDYLYPAEMPDLADIDWENLPVSDDPLKIDVTTIYKYSMADGNLPADFPSNAGTTYKTGQQAAYYDGIFYVNDYGTSTLLTYNKDGAVANNLKGTNSHGIAVDDAGNLVLRADGITSSPKKLLLYKRGTTEGVEIDFSLLNPGQTNFITASGDIFSTEGGYVYFFPNGQTVANIVKIAEGKLVEVTASGTLSLTGSTAGYIIPIDNDPANFVYQVRANGYYRYNDGDKGAYVAGGGSTRAPNRNNSVGGAYFTIGGHEVFVHSSGTNYNGGFTIRDMTAKSSPLHTEQPLGTAGYSGNVSCGSFMAVEQVDENSVNLYQYCMANGYAAYNIRVQGTTGIKVVEDSDAEYTEVNVFPNPVENVATVSYDGDIHTITVSSLTGAQVMSISGDGSGTDQIDLSALPKGLYFVTVNGTATTRIIKQ